MLWAVLRWTGSGRCVPFAEALSLTPRLTLSPAPRTMELAAVFQSVHTTMLRQQRVFEDSQSRMPVDNSPAAQWSAFITNEERRRTAMACYRASLSTPFLTRTVSSNRYLSAVLDGEAAVLLRTAPCMNGSELKTLLPCDESLWTAPNAEAWLEAEANVRDPVAIPVVLKLLSSDSATPLPAAINLSPFGAQCGLLLRLSPKCSLTPTYAVFSSKRCISTCITSSSSESQACQAMPTSSRRTCAARSAASRAARTSSLLALAQTAGRSRRTTRRCTPRRARGTTSGKSRPTFHSRSSTALRARRAMARRRGRVNTG